eukprot:CAMPEP_0195513706 /NCGR_PEP_ID=MMETSP0794_2-20130614/5299_1 /TAXON_ID=515487 /ORGANISM="Stephanopyxis turris, Strain CCMP 815" /LENGTH=177 /DNA_ID=CAMNT_0040641787 /DNA_START=103 /DNA_END=636 /DNA_ORIENTATION=-
MTKSTLTTLPLFWIFLTSMGYETGAFTTHLPSPAPKYCSKPPMTTTTLFAIGPLARAKKALDPAEYNRIVEQKMKQDKLSRKEAEDDYNAFLENPPFYYALDKKEAYYKSLGYKDMYEGEIGEAEKEGRGDEVRERIAKFKQRSQVKAYSVLAVAVVGFCALRQFYLNDPDGFLPGL